MVSQYEIDKYLMLLRGFTVSLLLDFDHNVFGSE